MKIILSALILGAEPVIVEKITAPVEIHVSSGQEEVAQIRKEYVEGKYNELFKELDVSYNKVMEEGDLQQLIDMRLGPIAEQESWNEIMKAILQERNKLLLKAVANESAPLVNKVASATLPISSEVDAALARLTTLRLLPPGAGVNADENTLIDISLQYEYKALHLDLLGSSREKQLALKMEEMDQMLAISQSFEDRSLQAAVKTVHAHLDSILTRSWDMADLQLLARNAETPIEKKIESILTHSREQLSDLSQALLNHEEN